MDAAFAQTVLEHSPDALVLLAPDGSISFLNNAAERLFGYARAQVLGADYSLLPLDAVAGKTRVMDDAFISDCGTDVTDAFRLYLRPLLGSGLTDAYRLRPAPVAKVLHRGA